MARLIRAAEELRQVFRDESPNLIPAWLSRSAAGRAVLAEMDTVLRRYGHRETAMPGAAFPTWRDAPSIVNGLLKGFVADERDASTLDADEGRPGRR